MMTSKLSAIMMLAAMLACSDASAVTGLDGSSASRLSALTNTTNEQDVPFNYVGPNPCNGDEVLLDGTSHVIMHTTLNTNGLTPGVHMETHFISRASGMDVLEVKRYSGKAEDHNIVEVPDPTATVLFNTVMLVNGPERTDDFFLHLVSKITFNANGTPTAVFEKPTTRCR